MLLQTQWAGRNTRHYSVAKTTDFNSFW